ncbi:nucleoside 2-deoxyribosyltransferase [Actinosynnema sp. NPDC053489]|uniref:nucleoside 2-deoxyribosyltransferase n=1 Tax=Actinosynnema sp. NPDC053489 TaxID=3363916 RepID=UPI0037C87B5F
MSREADNGTEVLNGLDLFVGGPIQHALSPDGFTSDLERTLKLVMETLREYGANIYSAHTVEHFGDRTAHYTPEQVAARDLRWMSKCDVFIPVLPVTEDGVLMRTDGTHVELGWATALGRPIVLITQQPIVESASHLLKGLHRVGDVQLLDVERFAQAPFLLVEHVLRATKRQREAVRSSVVLARA